MQDKRKAGFYVIAGGYLLYLAYQLFGSRMDNGGESYAVMLTFSIIFAIASMVILIYTAIMYRKILKREAEEEKELEQSSDSEQSSDPEEGKELP